MLDTALEAKVLAKKAESKWFKPLIAVIRPVRDKNPSLITADGAYHCPVGSIWPFFDPI